MSELSDALRRATDEASEPVELSDVVGPTVPARSAAPGGGRFSRRGLAVAVLVLAVGSLAAVWSQVGVGGGERVTAGPPAEGAERNLSPAEARASLEEFMLLRAASHQVDRGYATLGELVAGTSDPRVTRRDFALVVGRVVDVEALAGYYPGEGDDEATTYRVDFEDPAALWQTVVLDVEVDESLVGALDGTVRVGFPADPRLSVADMRSAFESYGTVALALERSAVFDDEPDLLAIVDDGETFMTIDSAGNIGLPFMAPGTAEILGADVPTLDQLRVAAATRPA